MEKIVIWGTGKSARNLLVEIDEKLSEVIAYVDNNIERQGHYFAGIKVISPDELGGLNFDRIVIASVKYEDIKKEIEHRFGSAYIIENDGYFLKQRIINYYSQMTGHPYAQEMAYLQTHSLCEFPYHFSDRYSDMEVSVYFDEDKGLFYVIHCGKKMYMKRSMKNENEVRNYYRNICMEQDTQSPHYYWFDQRKNLENAVIADAGVAEGNFSLEIVDQVKRLYLLEADEEWIEALQYTFADYLDKVKIIPCFLSDKNHGITKTLDEIIDERIDLLKMDIEGNEIRTLIGANRFLNQESFQLLVCTYHRETDRQDIAQYLKKMGAEIKYSDGYMFFLEGSRMTGCVPKLTKGLIKAVKNK